MPRSEYRSDYSPPAPSRRGGTTRITEYEDDIEIRNKNGRRRPRERDYLRDAYDRGSERDDVMIVRKEVDERSTRSGRRDRDRSEEEEVVISRSEDKRRDRPRRREVIEEEEEDIRIRERDLRGSISERISVDEETVSRRRRERPIEHEEIREEIIYRPRRERPERGYDREEISEEWIHVPRPRPSVVREVEEWRYGPKRRSRSENFESITIKERDRDRPREDIREEEIDIRERDRRGPRFSQETEITIRERERDRDRDRDRPREEEISIHESERDDRRSDSRDEEIRISERDSRDPGRRDEEIRIREREHESEWRERTRGSDRDDGRGSNASDTTRREHREEFKEEIIIKRDERDGPGGRMDELVIRRKERSPSPEPIPVPAPIPPPPESEPIIRAPPIHQEIITHHRHIDHGYEPYEPPASAPPRIRTPSPPSPETPPKSTTEEITIRHRDGDGGHEDDIIIKQRSREESRPVVPRRRSVSVDGSVISRRAPPPEIERRRFVGERPPTDTMWTEITKDLVTKEAIERFGYEYEETEWYFYVMEYLGYEDVRRLAKASDEIRARRRERIRQIERESREPGRFSPRSSLSDRPWEEERERIVEREWYGPRPPRPIILPRPLSPPGPPPRFVERDRVVVIRGER